MRLGASSRSTVARSWARARSKTTRLGAGEHLGNRLRIRARRLLARVPNVEERVAAVQRQALCKVVLTRGSRRVVPPCIARFVVTPAAIFFQTPARSGQYDMRSMTPDAPTCPATSISTVPESSRGVTAAIVPPRIPSDQPGRSVRGTAARAPTGDVQQILLRRSPGIHACLGAGSSHGAGP